MNNKKSNYESDDVRIYRREALKAAHDLCYGDEVKARIKNATSSAEIARIMRTARNGRD